MYGINEWYSCTCRCLVMQCWESIGFYQTKWLFYCKETLTRVCCIIRVSCSRICCAIRINCDGFGVIMNSFAEIRNVTPWWYAWSSSVTSKIPREIWLGTGLWQNMVYMARGYEAQLELHEHLRINALEIVFLPIPQKDLDRGTGQSFSVRRKLRVCIGWPKVGGGELRMGEWGGTCPFSSYSANTPTSGLLVSLCELGSVCKPAAERSQWESSTLRWKGKDTQYYKEGSVALLIVSSIFVLQGDL